MTKEFDSPAMLEWLEGLSNEALDALDFGVVKMDSNANVLFYNIAESDIAGVTKENAMGKNFFTQVAPCTNNFMVAEKYKKQELDEILQYMFTYITQPIPVKLRLLKSPAGNQYMVVKKV